MSTKNPIARDLLTPKFKVRSAREGQGVVQAASHGATRHDQYVLLLGRRVAHGHGWQGAQHVWAIRSDFRTRNKSAPWSGLPALSLICGASTISRSPLFDLSLWITARVVGYWSKSFQDEARASAVQVACDQR